MVAELIDVFRAPLTYHQAWLCTIIGFGAVLLLHYLSFNSTWRMVAFALIFGIYFLLLFDARLFFIIPYFLTWKLRGWKQYVMATSSLLISVDGFILVFYAMLVNKGNKERAIASVGVFSVLLLQTWLLGNPFFHLFHNISGYGFEANYPHLTPLQYVAMMYNTMWGWQGVVVGFLGVLAAAYLMKRGDLLTILYSSAYSIMFILRPFLLADLWRYFMPQIMIASGILEVKK